MWPFKRKPLEDRLTFSAHARCQCGSGLVMQGQSIHGYWDCADIVLGRAIPKGEPGSVQHSDVLPYIFYEIKSENQPSARGATTRPPKKV